MDSAAEQMAGRYVRLPDHQNVDGEEDARSEVDSITMSGSTESSPETEQVFQDTVYQHPEESSSDIRIGRIERAIADLAQIMIEKEQESKKQKAGAIAPGSCLANENIQPGVGTIRIGQLRPFPRDIPSNRLWEEWRKYLETFEISMSLQQVNEPNMLAKGLYLAVGDYLQGILRTANLRPIENGPSCYENFVKSVDAYLRSMTDPVLEHDSFLAMEQEVGESAVSFNARLVDRARLGDYGPVAEERVVLSQLMKGLRDKDIAKTAKMYDHDAKFIVRAATRSEALEPQPGSSGTGSVHAVNRDRDTQQARKRTFTQGNNGTSAERDNSFRSSMDRGSNDAGRHRGKKQRRFGHEKKNKCSRCNHWIHDNRDDCPALKAKCYECGAMGHFAITCRKKGERRNRDAIGDAEDQVYFFYHSILLNMLFAF